MSHSDAEWMALRLRVTLAEAEATHLRAGIQAIAEYADATGASDVYALALEWLATTSGPPPKKSTR